MSKRRLSKQQKCILVTLYSVKERKYGSLTFPAYTLTFYNIRNCLIRDLNKYIYVRSPDREYWLVSPTFSASLSRSLSNLLEKGLIERTGYHRIRKFDKLRLTDEGIKVCLKLISQGINFKSDYFRNKKVKVEEFGLSTGYKRYWIDEKKLQRAINEKKRRQRR